MIFQYFGTFSCVVFGQGTLILKLSNCFSGDSDNFKHEKEDMIIKSENNSIAWSSEDDVPPQIIIQNSNSSKKLEPLLKPLKYKSPPTKEWADLLREIKWFHEFFCSLVTKKKLPSRDILKTKKENYILDEKSYNVLLPGCVCPITLAIFVILLKKMIILLVKNLWF